MCKMQKSIVVKWVNLQYLHAHNLVFIPLFTDEDIGKICEKSH